MADDSDNGFLFKSPFVPPEPDWGFVLRHPDRQYREHMADAMRYARRHVPKSPSARRGADDRFMIVSPALAGELEPDAMVTFDRDLESVIANPVFITRWGHLYVASLWNEDICWCWNAPDARWDDISGGTWVPPHNREWREVLVRASELSIPHYVHEIIIP